MSNVQKAWRGTCLALLLMLVYAAPTGAQTTLGRVAGTVLDSSGAVLPGATITMTSDQTNQIQTAVSGATGAFLFPQVPVGTYKVEIALQGFKSATFTKVSVAVAQEYSLTARLELGNVSENVTVEAGVSLVPTTSPEVSTTVGQQQIVSLPLNGRNPISLVQLQAGVASMGRTSTAINGGRATWTQVAQDGVNIQDNFIRTNSVDFVPNRPTSDNVAEFSIVTTAQGADNAAGTSQVRMVTPSGTKPIQRQRVRVQPPLEVRGQHLLQQALEPAGQLLEPESVRRQLRRTGSEKQVVLLRQLRSVPPETAGRAELHDSRQQRSAGRHVPLLRRG